VEAQAVDTSNMKASLHIRRATARVHTFQNGSVTVAVEPSTPFSYGSDRGGRRRVAGLPQPPELVGASVDRSHR